MDIQYLIEATTFSSSSAPIYIYDSNMNLVKTTNQSNLQETHNLFGAHNGYYYIFTNVNGQNYSVQFAVDLE